MKKEKYRTSEILSDLYGAGGLERVPANNGGRQLESPGAALGLSPLFLKLIAYVDRRHLAGDRIYFRLVSEIAELLPDEEVAFLARYFVPPVTGQPRGVCRRMPLAARTPRKRDADVSRV